jgi:hypothetical protein
VAWQQFVGPLNARAAGPAYRLLASERCPAELLWKLRIAVRPEGEPEFEVDIEHYFRNRTPPNEGSTMTVLFDPADHSKVSVDPTSLVCAPRRRGWASRRKFPSMQARRSEAGPRSLAAGHPDRDVAEQAVAVDRNGAGTSILGYQRNLVV